MGKGAARSASRRRPLIMTFPLSRFPFPGFRLPRPRLPPRLIVQEKNHRPDLPLGEEVLPHRHRRIPRRALAGEAGPALGDAPEHEALGELRDRAVVLEVRGERVEAGCEVSLAVEVVAMTRETVPVVDVFAIREVRGEQDPHRLPERMLGVPPDGGGEGGAHLCAARYCTSASSCWAFIMVPKLLGMIPASFS